MPKAQENNLFGFKMKRKSCKVEIDKCLIKCLPSITLSTAHLPLQLLRSYISLVFGVGRGGI